MDGRALGIDVSHHNEDIDWDGVAQAGISFAFAKASQGADPTTSWYTDATFATNWQAMKDAGLVRGAYHFVGLPLPSTPRASWNDDIHSQIDHFLHVIGPLDPGDLRPVLDLEDGDSPKRWKSLINSDRDAALSIVREMITYTTAQLDGTPPIIYTGSFWWSELGDPDPDDDNMPFGSSRLWMAQYPIGMHSPMPVPGPPGSTDQGEAGNFAEYSSHLDGHQPRHIPKVWGGPSAPAWAFWQFSEFGRLPDLMSGMVDLDVFNGPASQLSSCCMGP
jgi:lysozyme